DLRNPLHSATLLVEALAAGSQADMLRTKLRGQFAKLDALISAAAVPIRDMAVEPRATMISLRDLFAKLSERVGRTGDVPEELTLELRDPPEASLACDPALLARAVTELAACLTEEHQTGPRGSGRAPVVISADASDDKTIRIDVGLPGVAFA